MGWTLLLANAPILAFAGFLVWLGVDNVYGNPLLGWVLVGVGLTIGGLGMHTGDRARTRLKVKRHFAMRRVPGHANPECVGDFYWKFDTDTRKRSLVVAVPWPSNDKPIWSSWTIDHLNNSLAQWSWNKDEDKPTLYPSLNWVGVWHGWVENGVMRDA